MNIFVLDEAQPKMVEYYVDDHVLKMIIESGQMLCMTNYVHVVLGYTPRDLTDDEKDEVKAFANQFREDSIEDRPIPYLPTKRHLNHPCTLWTRKSKSNWEYLQSLIFCLNLEYKYRFESEEDHKTYRNLKKLEPPSDLKDKGLTDFPQAMPDEYKSDDAIQSYRDYYCGEKQHIAEWRKRPQPKWFQNKNE